MTKTLTTLLTLLICTPLYADKLQIKNNSDRVSNLTTSERKLMVGSLYLSQCAIRSDDFKSISDGFNPSEIELIGKSESDRSKYYDAFAETMLHLGNDACIVEIMTQDYEKFVETLPSLVTVPGGKLTLKKGKSGYYGNIMLNGKSFLIRVFSDGAKENNIVTGAIVRK